METTTYPIYEITTDGKVLLITNGEHQQPQPIVVASIALQLTANENNYTRQTTEYNDRKAKLEEYQAEVAELTAK